MEHKIIEFPAKKVVGMVYTGKNAHQEIAELWKVFMTKYTEVEGSNSDIMYGLCYDYSEDGQFSYLAGVEVDSLVNLPAGMKLKEIPKRNYAVFTFKDHVSKMGAFWDKIYQEYLPANNLTPDFAMSFELYDDRFPKTGECDIYIPLK